MERNAEVAAALGLGFPIAADPELRAIDAYGVRDEQSRAGTPIARPASFLIDANGVVRWRDLTENFRIRPHPDVILAAIDRLARERQ